MIIDTNSLNSTSANSTRNRNTVGASQSDGKSQAPAAPAPASLASKDHVVLSPEAQNLVKLQAKVANSPDVNLDRVAAIKLAIAEGRFEINPERIAENMLNQDALLG